MVKISLFERRISRKLKIEIEIEKKKKERKRERARTRNEVYNSIICHGFREREPSNQGTRRSNAVKIENALKNNAFPSLNSLTIGNKSTNSYNYIYQ